MLADLLEGGHCLIIFDALDEITIQEVRNKVKNAIASFSEIYYLNRYIITSRETGYLRNRFDESFLHIRINEFEEEQIEKYARNWVAVNYENEDFEDFWMKFQIEVNRARCDNLIKNPIILILALVIFDTQKNLPNTRVEFYQRCIDTFLSVREDRRATHNLSEKAKNILGLDLVVPKVAHYKFDRVNNDMGYVFSETELRNAVFEAIEVPDKINWTSAVDEYSKYLVERTELIREIDEGVLDFAHKTFFEYFLAVFYMKEFEDDELINLLNKWIGDSNYDELARLIIEVIIRNNNSRQHQKVIDFLLSAAEKTEDVNVFSIVADLYSHNMLLPKYHNRYFKFILYHPRLAKVPIFFRTSRSRNYSRVEYDSIALAQIYRNAVNEEGRFADTLDALYYLDDAFRNYSFIGISDERHGHIVSLLRCVSQRAKIDPVATQELAYFSREPAGVEMTLNYPQIFLSVLFCMANQGNFNNVENIALVQFKSNRKFMEYTNPSTLSMLFKQSMDSCVNLVVLLTAIIHCACKDTNRLFLYVLDPDNLCKMNISQKSFSSAYWLWCALNETKSYEEFCEILLEKSLFDCSYDHVLKKMYADYERSDISERLSKVINKIRRNGNA